MPLTKTIAELMTFALPPDWHESKHDGTNDSRSAIEELTANLTEEAREAITPHLQESAHQTEIDLQLAPAQYGAGANWSTLDNLAVLNVFADIVFYSNWELAKTDALLKSQGPIAPSEVTRGGQPIFSMFYSDRGRLSMPSSTLDEESQPATVCADPALLEAFYELKATLESADNSGYDFRILSASVVDLRGRTAALVESDHYCYGVVERQIGYHLLLDRERKDADWLVEEVHISLRCTPANSEYVSKDFQLFVESITWLDHN